jgi:hypothetical protein
MSWLGDPFWAGVAIAAALGLAAVATLVVDELIQRRRPGR